MKASGSSFSAGGRLKAAAGSQEQLASARGDGSLTIP